jgi:hypothetical protein
MQTVQKKGRGKWIGLLLIAIAIGNELRKAPEDRTWHDRLFGILPYDFRRPTWARVKKTLWNPQSERIFVPHAFGVGWTVNLGGLMRRAGVAGG